MMMKKQSIFRTVAAFICGTVLTLSFAPFAIFPFAILSLAGLIALTAQQTPSRAGWLGFSFGLGLFSTGIYWIFISISRYGDVPGSVALLITAALVAFLSTFPAIACYFTNRWFGDHEKTRTLYAFPTFWVLLEWARCWLFTGFPWLLVGYSQTNSPLKGYAPLFSVYGVTLAAVISSGLIVQAIREYQSKKYQRAYTRVFALTSIWVLGGLLALIPWTEQKGNPVKISLVQGDIPQSLKWDPDQVQLSLDRYAKLSQPLFGHTNLIVWPEAAIPLGLNNALDYLGQLNTLAKKTNTPIIVGIPIENNKGAGYFNALLSLGFDKQTYVKRQLVPFGEYIPFHKIAGPVFDFMKVPMANMIAGNMNQNSFQLGSLKIDASICYEVAFPELMRTTDRNVNLLLTATNDAWFGQSTAQAQHLQMAAMRAIELARPLVFVSNDGITAAINAKGIILDAAPTHEPTVLTVNVQPLAGLTPWMKNGTDPLLALMLFLLYLARRQTKKYITTPSIKRDEHARTVHTRID